MFRALLRTQFASLWAALTRSSTGSKKKSSGRAVLVAILFIYIIGCFFSGLIQISLTLSYPLFAGLGIMLTIFALWLFYTDFQTADQSKSNAHET